MLEVGNGTLAWHDIRSIPAQWPLRLSHIFKPLFLMELFSPNAKLNVLFRGIAYFDGRARVRTFLRYTPEESKCSDSSDLEISEIRISEIFKIFRFSATGSVL